MLTATVRLRAGRSYGGESRAGTVFRQADGANLPALVASDVWLDNTTWTGSPMAIRRLTLDGNRAGNPTGKTAGLVLRAWLSVAEDLHITGMGSDGLRLTSLSADGTALKNSQVNGRIADCFIERSGRHGIFVEDPGNAVTDWILRDNWIASSGADGIHLDNAAGWMIERNHIYGVPHHAIYAHRLFATSISDNYIEGFGETTEPGTWCGIAATLQGDAASTLVGNRVFCFAGEKQEASTYRYLSLTVNYGEALASVTGNTIRGAGTPRGTGLYYAADAGRALTVVSAGNAVDKVALVRSVGERVTVSAGQ
ncbi:MAG: right-handed parallel beta-helix repeat-containing protein [Armatimonadetes bacterium]|nr:right-handed parallel beta-helix repeat-containing protein [Armatimonadota bacterium]